MIKNVAKNSGCDKIKLTDVGKGIGTNGVLFVGPGKHGSGDVKMRIPTHSPSSCGLTIVTPWPTTHLEMVKC